MVYMGVCQLIIHLIITMVGMIFVNADILSLGNEQLLNNLEEGIMILDEDSQEVIFTNNALKQLQMAEDETLSMTNITVEGSHQLNLSKDDKLFAQIDTSLFKITPIDSASVITRIQDLQDYASLEQIIADHASKGYPARKLIYKL